MEPLRCASCGYENPVDARFCQKCANGLFLVCRRCGVENRLGVTFCKSCGTDLRTAAFALSREAVARWRSALGGLEGWSPAFSPGSKTLTAWATLSPPLVPGKEPLIFDVVVTHPWTPSPAAKPHDFYVGSVTIRGVKFHLTQTFLGGVQWAYLLATDSRLVAYHPESGRALQVRYDEITAINVEGDKSILRLNDGGTAEILTRNRRSGALALMAILGAPMVAKGDIVRIERRKEERASTFVATFT